MANRIEARCLLSKRACPETCPNYEMAVEVAKKFGDQFDPYRFRMEIIFGDINRGINVHHVELALARCEGERKNILER